MGVHSTHSRKRALSIGFPLVSVALTIATYVAFGGALPLAPEGYRVAIPLHNALNVVVGSDVRTSGVKIGKVVRVARTGNTGLATIELEPQFLPLRSGATAIPRVKTLLGEGYIEIAPGAPSAPPIPDGGRLAADRVRQAVTLDDFVSTFSPDTRRRMRQLFAGMASALDGRGPALNDTLAYSAPFSSDLNTVLHTLDGQTGQLQQIFSSSGDVLDALGRRTGVVQGAITAADRMLAISADRDRELAATIHALPPFLHRLRRAADAITAASPELVRAAAAATPLAAPLAQTISQVLATAPSVQTVFGLLPALIDAGHRQLPVLTRIVRATAPSLAALYPAMRELIPFVQLLATYREAGIVGPIATASSAGAGKYVGPGGKIITYGGASLYFSNETIAGWTKRLPSDRSNPYPKPDRLLGLARQGFLSAYDCRNIHNPNLLPPLGTGVPPCIEQGPWTYRGKSAYYPRLGLGAP